MDQWDREREEYAAEYAAESAAIRARRQEMDARRAALGIGDYSHLSGWKRTEAGLRHWAREWTCDFIDGFGVEPWTKWACKDRGKRDMEFLNQKRLLCLQRQAKEEN